MPKSSARSRVRLFLTLFLALNFFYLLTSSGRVRTIDEASAAFQTESMVTRLTTSVPQAVLSNIFYGKRDRNGNPQAPYGLGQAVVTIPWYLAGMAFSKLPGVPPGAQEITLDVILVSSSATLSALAAALAFLIFLRLGIAVRAALAATLLLALATPLFAYSSWFFSEPLTTVLLLAAALILFTGDADSAISSQQSYRAGLLLGAVLWVRPTHALAVLVFFLAVLIRERGRSARPAIFMLLVVALFGVGYLMRNRYLFGSPFDFGYPAAAEGGKQLNGFNTPILHGLFGFLFSPGKSIFIFAPPILLAIFGLRRLAKRDVGLAVVAGGTPLAYLLFFSRYTQWEGGYCFGPRYLVPALALLCLGLGPLLNAVDASWIKSVRRLAVVLFIAGFLAQGIGMATSFLEDQANGSYYDQNYDYRMSYNPLASQTRLLLHYAASRAPAPLGLGFDRWFVFIAKIGVSHRLILIVWFLEWAITIFFTWQLEGLVARPRDDG